MPISKSVLLRRISLVLIDALLLSAAWFLCYLLRFDFSIPSYEAGFPDDYRTQALLMLPWVVLLHLALFAAFQLYRGIVRYVSTEELKAIVFASAISVAFWLLFDLWVERRETFLQLPVMSGPPGEYHVMRIPFSILLMYFFTSVILAGGFRFSRRLWVEGRARVEQDAPATLIVGAGGLARNALREILNSGSGQFRPVCAVSTDPQSVGASLQGVRVRGLVKDIPELLRHHHIGTVLIALDDDDPAVLREVVGHCTNAKVEFHIIPTMRDIAGGRVDVRPMRRVQLRDLLGREPVRLELPDEKNYLAGETVLVTGAGGSIGRELCRQVAWARPRRVVLLGKGENSIYEIHQELMAAHPEINIVPVVADVRDEAAMFRLFETHKPSIVFHAAAHKHVPLMEAEPNEAVKNNVLGTAVVAWLAHHYKAKRFVMISTDKAVRPVSVMGATKALAELVVFSLGAQSETVFQAVRFGNVLGSRGSVVPTFERQIARGGPITVTHPDVSRFFMTIPEAVSLVIQSGVHPDSGLLFLLDMGQPIRILDIVRHLITLSGLKEGQDIEIKYTGLRPGEKLHEELLTSAEGAQKTEVGKVWVTRPRDVPLWSEMQVLLRELCELADEGAPDAVLDRLREILPDYHPAALVERGDGEALDRFRREAEEEIESEMLSARSQLGLLEGRQLLQGDLFGDDTPAEVDTAEEQTVVEEALDYGDFAGIIDLFDEGAEGQQRQSLTSASAGGQEMSPALREGDGQATDGASGEGHSADSLAAIAEEGTASAPTAVPRSPLQEDSSMTVRNSAQTNAQPDENGSGGGAALVYFALLDGVPVAARRALFGDLIEKIAPDSTLVVSGIDGVEELPEPLRHRTTPLPADISTVPGRWNAAAKACPPGALLVALGAAIRLHPTFSEKVELAAQSHPDAPIFYADHITEQGGKERIEQLHDHDGCPHERFDFGQVLIYRAGAVLQAGGFDEGLQHAWEYDMQLRLMEHGPFIRIATPIYTVIEPAEEETQSGALYSPGRGKLGGFSYVFYPPDVEKEVTTVFEKALKRWGAWLDHPTVEVPQPKEKPAVLGSVVIPVLNRRRFIGNAIQKVLDGTFKDIEVVVVDNGSTDGTQDVVNEIAARDPRVRLLKGTGTSIASALNDGIRAARGKYICQLDSDDEYVPTTLEKMLGHLESHPKCGLAISYYRLIDVDGNVIEDVSPITHSGYTRNQILRRDGAGALRVFPKAVLEEFGLYDEEHYGNFGEDYDMVLKTGEKYDVDRVHEVLYHYRRHGDNTDVIRAPEMKYKNKNHARQQALRRRIAINRALGKKPVL